MKKLGMLALLAIAATAYGYPSCGTSQINVGSLANCTSDAVNFTNWSFSAAGYTGTATIQIEVPAAGQYGTDPEIVTLRFSKPQLGPINFSLGYDVTLTNGFQVHGVVQEILAGNVPNNATSTGSYNAMSLMTSGSSFATVFNQGMLAPTNSVNVGLLGMGSLPAPPPPCGPPGLCGGGPIQKIEMNFYQSAPSSVPEPVTAALVGLGLVGLAIVRRRR